MTFGENVEYCGDCWMEKAEWKVFFDGDFWGHPGKDHAGTEIRLDRQFDWAGHHWSVSAVYACGKGLVVDFCMRVEAEDMENSLCLDFNPQLELNGKIMTSSHGCSVSFNVCLPDENDVEVKAVMDHYSLDTSYGWVISRNAFPWPVKHRPKIKTLSLIMEQRPTQIPGPHFKPHASGDLFTFKHPVSGIEYVLTVQKLEQQTIPQNRPGSDRWIYPENYIAMSYTLSPEPDERIVVCDCNEGDRPREIVTDEDDDSVIARFFIIGGASGPTMITCAGNSQEKLHTAASSLHFEPILDDIEWRIMFSVRQFEQEKFVLLPEGGNYADDF